MARRRRFGGSKRLEEAAAPSLTSLMDVVTILLVYFVKTFAVSPINVQDPSVQLPASTSMENVEDATLVMITGAYRKETGPDGKPIMIKDVPTLVVDDKVLLHLDDNHRINDRYKDRGYVIRPLKQELIEIRKLQGVTAEITEGQGFTGKIVIIADKDTPYRVLTDVLVTCSEAGFADFKFAIVKQSG